MAHAELDYFDLSPASREKVGLTEYLAKRLPGRTVEGIKGQRRTASAKYGQILETVRAARALVLPGPAVNGNGTEAGHESGDEAGPSDGTDQSGGGSASPMSLGTDAATEVQGSGVSAGNWRTPLSVWAAQYMQLEGLGSELRRLASIMYSGGELPEEAVTSALNTLAPASDELDEKTGTSQVKVKVPAGETKGGPELDGKTRRRIEYRKMQTEWRKNRGRVASSVLDGTWKTKGPSAKDIPPDTQISYWKGIFEAERGSDDRPVHPVQEEQSDLVRPILPEEVARTQKSLPVSAPGPDGMKVGTAKGLDPVALALVFNGILYSERPPKSFLHSRTVLLKKVPVPTDPSQYRPISISNFVCRLFHKVLAYRMSTSLALSTSQKAFREVDGIAANVELLEGIAQEAKRRLRPLRLAFIDLKKAFDSVHHDTIIRCAQRQGIPEPLLRYLRRYYDGGTTLLLGQDLRMCSGVRQGDPLSPLLFNAVIDEALKIAEAECAGAGFKFSKSELPIKALAFADDLVLISDSDKSIQRLADSVLASLGRGGLRPNPAKCAQSRVDVVGKSKRWYQPNGGEPLKIAGEEVVQLGVEDVYKYLGIKFAGIGRAQQSKALVDQYQSLLQRISSAPLKPQQRLYILRDHGIPKLSHSLVLGKVTLGDLCEMDKMSRSIVRQWTGLPHDVAKSFIHGNVEDGALGVPSFRTMIPRQSLARMKRLEASEEPDIKALTSSEWWAVRCAQVLYKRAAMVASKAAEREFWRNQFHSDRCDGAGLREASVNFAGGDIFKSGNMLTTGYAFRQIVAIRANTFPSRERAMRGRGRGSEKPMCEAGCRAIESLSHMVQSCVRTYDRRNKSHNRIAAFLEKRCRPNLSEPHISTPIGLRRPDIIVRRGDVAYLVDVQVTSDSAVGGGQPLVKAYDTKVGKYSHPSVAPSILRHVKTHWAAVERVEFGALIVSWRGVLSGKSASLLRTLGIPKADLNLVCLKALEGSAESASVFRRRTERSIRPTSSG